MNLQSDSIHFDLLGNVTVRWERRVPFNAARLAFVVDALSQVRNAMAVVTTPDGWYEVKCRYQRDHGWPPPPPTVVRRCRDGGSFDLGSFVVYVDE